MTRGHYSHMNRPEPEVQQTIRELTIDLCIQTIQSRYMGDNNREDMEVKACVNTLKRLKETLIE